MNKKEVSEIKKQFRPENCTLTKICTCYVNGDKEKMFTRKEAFLSLPEEEIFKYFDIFRKTLSGGLGKNLINLSFPLEAEEKDGQQERLLKLQDSKFADNELLDAFFDRVIELYPYHENYAIILVQGEYDIPGRGSDNTKMFDASEDVYSYMLCAICPVSLSDAGLSYHGEKGCFGSRTRDWVVKPPMTGFLFPAFNDRNTDIHSTLYYTKSDKDLKADLVEGLLGISAPMSAEKQKTKFASMLEETLQGRCTFDTVKEVYGELNDLVDEHEGKEDLILKEEDVRKLLTVSGLEAEEIKERMKDSPGTEMEFLADNLAERKKFVIETQDVTVQVDPDRMDLVEMRDIDGQACLVIRTTGRVEVNGVITRK